MQLIHSQTVIGRGFDKKLHNLDIYDFVEVSSNGILRATKEITFILDYQNNVISGDILSHGSIYELDETYKEKIFKHVETNNLNIRSLKNFKEGK